MWCLITSVRCCVWTLISVYISQQKIHSFIIQPETCSIFLSKYLLNPFYFFLFISLCFLSDSIFRTFVHMSSSNCSTPRNHMLSHCKLLWWWDDQFLKDLAKQVVQPWKKSQFSLVRNSYIKKIVHSCQKQKSTF